MDLHIIGGEPTDAEQAAIDAVLPPEAVGERHWLLPALHAAQDRVGWVSRGALNHICRRLGVPPAEAWGVVTFYHLLSTTPSPQAMIHVCDDVACRAQGAERLCAALAARLGPAATAHAPGHGPADAGATASPGGRGPADGRAGAGAPSQIGPSPAPADAHAGGARSQIGPSPASAGPHAGGGSPRPDSSTATTAGPVEGSRAAERAPLAGAPHDDTAHDGEAVTRRAPAVPVTGAAAAESGEAFPPPLGWQRSPCLGQCDAGSAALVVSAGAVPRRFVVAPVGAVEALLVRAAEAAAATEAPPSAAGAGRAPWAPPSGEEAGRAVAGGPAHGPGAAAEPAPAPARGGADARGGRVSAVAPAAAPGPAPAPASSPAAPRSEAPLTCPGRIARADGRPRLLARVGRVDPWSLQSYRDHGGGAALARAVALGPDGVIDALHRARLVGRGGAAFPTARKWEAARRQAAVQRYVVANADESEPGTFKDRVLMEGDPFALIEAMAIAGLTVGATRGFIYLRGEYPEAEARLAHAIREAVSARWLGDSVTGTGHAFHLALRRGGGAYICGEETALAASIEGFRGEPRSKPPFPTTRGLFGAPTVTNNVETLVNVLDILTEGPESWAAAGTPDSTGPRLFSVSGHVLLPGVYEVPSGTTLRRLIDLAGGLHQGRALQAVLLGGAAGAFVGPQHLDLPLSNEAARTAGVTLGSGVVLVLDDTAQVTDLVRRIARFFRDESCGQCVPCRVGTVRQLEWLDRRDSAPLDFYPDLTSAMKDASICGLGQTATTAIESALALGLLSERDPP